MSYQSGANRNEIKIIFVCIRRVKATKRSKSRSNYPFLFLYLSRIRKGLTVRQNKNKTGRTNVSVVVLSDLRFSSPTVANKNKMIFTCTAMRNQFTWRTHVLETCFVVPNEREQWPCDFVCLNGTKLEWVVVVGFHTESGIRNVLLFTPLYSMRYLFPTRKRAAQARLMMTGGATWNCHWLLRNDEHDLERWLVVSRCVVNPPYSGTGGWWSIQLDTIAKSQFGKFQLAVQLLMCHDAAVSQHYK